MRAMNSLPLPFRWLPALVVMGLIFFFSSLPADLLPDYGVLDFLVKKGGHAIGYALLASAYFYALPPRLSAGYKAILALLMAILFALSDEFHQSFVQGRTSSLRDVAIDGMGAIAGLGVARIFHSSNSSSNSTG
jgi:VanZ family protein